MPDSIIVYTQEGEKQEFLCEKPANLAEFLHIVGALTNRVLCAGLGKCGLCRVRYLDHPPTPNATDISRLPPRDLEQGWRLACQRQARPGLVLELPAAEGIPASAPAPGELDPQTALAFCLDLGSTSLHWSMLQHGERRARGVEPNPQTGLGAEVMSRMAAAQAGRGPLLAGLVLDRIQTLADESPAPWEAMAVAGNPAMVHLLLGLDPARLAAAPYRLDYAGGETRALRSTLPDAYVPPLLGPFVGSDAACAALAEFRDSPGPLHPPCLLADLGTNGELVLQLPDDRFLAASAPMGPALEGAGLSCGRIAGENVAVRFQPSPDGLRALDAAGRGLDAPAGISGTGYLSLAALLRRLGLLDEWGRFKTPDDPLGRRIASSLLGPEQGPSRNLPLRREPMLDLGAGLFLPASDLEEIIKVKAAMNTAMAALLDAAGLRASRLTAIRLAGALGAHADPADMETLGFIPPGLAGLAQPAGDAALRGLEIAVRDPGARDWLSELPARTRVLDLPADPGFPRAFANRLRLDYA